MQSWECNLGVVSHWDTDLQCYEVRVLKICYNADEELPVKMIIESPSGELFAVSSSKELVVVANGDPLNVTINDELFILVDEQKAKLLSVGGKWSYNDGEIREVSLFDAIPGKYAKDFGLIYVNLDGSYTMANLIVDFDWNSSMPIIIFCILRFCCHGHGYTIRHFGFGDARIYGEICYAVGICGSRSDQIPEMLALFQIMPDLIFSL